MSSCQTIGAVSLASGVTTVDCEKQVRSWRLLRSLIELFIPSCLCAFTTEEETKQQEYHPLQQSYLYRPKPSNFTSSTTVKGTLFGFRRGKVSLYLQTNSKSAHSIVLLGLAVSTTTLAREMKGGILRIALDCTSHGHNNISPRKEGWFSRPSNNSLLSMPVWTMYCNGRKVGYATRRRPSKFDLDTLRLMSSVFTGAGIISGKELHRDDELMYLKANFGRVSGSSEAESFHLIDPDGSMGQELSIFFFRSS